MISQKRTLLRKGVYTVMGATGFMQGVASYSSECMRLLMALDDSPMAAELRKVMAMDEERRDTVQGRVTSARERIKASAPPAPAEMETGGLRGMDNPAAAPVYASTQRRPDTTRVSPSDYDVLPGSQRPAPAASAHTRPSSFPSADRGAASSFGSLGSKYGQGDYNTEHHSGDYNKEHSGGDYNKEHHSGDYNKEHSGGDYNKEHSGGDYNTEHNGGNYINHSHGVSDDAPPADTENASELRALALPPSSVAEPGRAACGAQGGVRGAVARAARMARMVAAAALCAHVTCALSCPRPVAPPNAARSAGGVLRCAPPAVAQVRCGPLTRTRAPPRPAPATTGCIMTTRTAARRAS